MSIDKKEVVSMFLEEGYQLDVGAVEFFTKNPNEIGRFIETMKGARQDTGAPATITLEYVLQTKPVVGAADDRRGGDGKDAISIEELSTKGGSKKTGVEEYTTLFTNHYESIKRMLLEKTTNTNFTSINKIQNQREVALIAMVREKDPVDKSILVEDTTGSTVVFVGPDASEDVKKDFESIVVNDVLGVVCNKSEGGLEIRHIIWPDIPLKRGVVRSGKETRCIFMVGFRVGGANPKQHRRLLEWLEKTRFKEIYLFILESDVGETDKIQENFRNNHAKIHTFVLSNPSEILLNGVNLLVVPSPHIDEWKSYLGESDDIKAAVNALKRRSLYFGGAPVTIGTPPDIIVTTTETEASKANYKGTTIVSAPHFENTGTAWLVELKSREINKLDFL